MNWRNPETEVPATGQRVWVLIQHWKEKGPLSCEIYCGEVVLANDGSELAVFNNDDIGRGSARWLLRTKHRERMLDTDIWVRAWAPVEELPIPSWLR